MQNLKNLQYAHFGAVYALVHMTLISLQKLNTYLGKKRFLATTYSFNTV